MCREDLLQALKTFIKGYTAIKGYVAGSFIHIF